MARNVPVGPATSGDLITATADNPSGSGSYDPHASFRFPHLQVDAAATQFSTNHFLVARFVRGINFGFTGQVDAVDDAFPPIRGLFSSRACLASATSNP